MVLVVEELGFKLVPHREGLCYELYEWRPERELTVGRHAGKVAPAGWVALGFYPTTISQGFRKILELATNADPVVLASVSEAATRIEAAAQAIARATWSEMKAP